MSCTVVHPTVLSIEAVIHSSSTGTLAPSSRSNSKQLPQQQPPSQHASNGPEGSGDNLANNAEVRLFLV